MTELVLPNKMIVLLDEEDWAAVSQFRWWAHRFRNTWYARTDIYEKENRKHLLMHRFIMNSPVGLEIDHINGNGLDNRRQNLRICTRAENARNSPRLTKGLFRGVHYYSRRRKWYSAIAYNGRSHHLGSFDDPIEAARAYDRAARQWHGEFAVLNFPEETNHDRHPLP